MKNISKEIKIRKVAAGAAAGTTAVQSSSIDASNYDGVLLFSTIATAAANNDITIEQSTDGTNFTALKEAKVVSEKNGQVVYVDVYRPDERQGKYLRAVINRGTSTATGDIYAIQYNGRTRPEVNLVDAVDGIKGILAISPDTI